MIKDINKVQRCAVVAYRRVRIVLLDIKWRIRNVSQSPSRFGETGDRVFGPSNYSAVRFPRFVHNCSWRMHVHS